MEWLQEAKSFLQSSGGHIIAPFGSSRCAMFNVLPRLATVHIFYMEFLLIVLSADWSRALMNYAVAGRRSPRLFKRPTCLSPSHKLNSAVNTRDVCWEDMPVPFRPVSPDSHRS